MPTKQTDDAIVLSPAVHYLLMTGTNPKYRIHGWVELAMVPLGELDGHVRVAWADHREALEHEAAAAGFVPWAATCRARPRGPAVKRWAETFISVHRY